MPPSGAPQDPSDITLWPHKRSWLQMPRVWPLHPVWLVGLKSLRFNGWKERERGGGVARGTREAILVEHKLLRSFGNVLKCIDIYVPHPS